MVQQVYIHQGEPVSEKVLKGLIALENHVRRFKQGKTCLMRSLCDSCYWDRVCNINLGALLVELDKAGRREGRATEKVMAHTILTEFVNKGLKTNRLPTIQI